VPNKKLYSVSTDRLRAFLRAYFGFLFGRNYFFLYLCTCNEDAAAIAIQQGAE